MSTGFSYLRPKVSHNWEARQTEEEWLRGYMYRYTMQKQLRLHQCKQCHSDASIYNIV